MRAPVVDAEWVTGGRNAPVLGVATSISLGLLAGMGSVTAHVVLVLAAAGVAGVAVAVLAPRWVYAVLGFVLGGLPFAVVPAAGPAALLFAVATGATVLLHSVHRRRLSSLEWVVVLLLAVSAASITQTATSAVHPIEFVKWAIACGLVLVLLRLSPADLSHVLSAFVVGTAVGGGLSLVLLLVDTTGTAINFLSPLGYGRIGTTGTTLRFAEVDGTAVTRLAGTYIHPNVAGLFLLIGLALAIARTSGAVRVITVPVIAVALVSTLSRAAIATVLVAAVLFFVIQSMRTAVRTLLLCGGLLTVIAVANVPAVAARIAGSFGSADVGSNDRARALAEFAPKMAGHWWFGHGWGAIELLDEVAAYRANVVANTILLTVYRGGLLVGAVFVMLLVAGCVLAYRCLRTPDWRSGVLGAIFLALVLVALQLDYPVATSPPVTMAFGVLLAAIVASADLPRHGSAPERSPTDSLPTEHPVVPNPPTPARSPAPRPAPSRHRARVP
ncbi:O-antigen ligase family protein [Rhodococcoides kroppenstedtii]|uniref:O-antigen ligase family protein n=1 Tax=Rhodococcoides kroppenstedtii TaxID=293050 RepID=UPI001BDECD06|nr:hypothetical protein [Rhodococcus kroppenstedtii]MBT1191860.1 hypothetical protein [Rhodococcus kroppenstedtii]